MAAPPIEKQKLANELSHALVAIEAAYDRKATMEGGVHTYLIGSPPVKLQVSRTKQTGKVEPFIVTDDHGSQRVDRPTAHFLNAAELKQWAEEQFDVVGVVPQEEAQSETGRPKRSLPAPAVALSTLHGQTTKTSTEEGGGKGTKATEALTLDAATLSLMRQLDERVTYLERHDDVGVLQRDWWAASYTRVKRDNPGKSEVELSFLMRHVLMPSDQELLKAADGPADRFRGVKADLQSRAEVAAAAQAALLKCQIKTSQLLNEGTSSG